MRIIVLMETGDKYAVTEDNHLYIRKNRMPAYCAFKSVRKKPDTSTTFEVDLKHIEDEAYRAIEWQEFIKK